MYRNLSARSLMRTSRDMDNYNPIPMMGGKQIRKKKKKPFVYHEDKLENAILWNMRMNDECDDELKSLGGCSGGKFDRQLGNIMNKWLKERLEKCDAKIKSRGGAVPSGIKKGQCVRGLGKYKKADLVEMAKKLGVVKTKKEASALRVVELKSIISALCKKKNVHPDDLMEIKPEWLEFDEDLLRGRPIKKKNMKKTFKDRMHDCHNRERQYHKSLDNCEQKKRKLKHDLSEADQIIEMCRANFKSCKKNELDNDEAKKAVKRLLAQLRDCRRNKSNLNEEQMERANRAFQQYFEEQRNRSG